jgi:CubicO group peptidase (beta-lactamase class C family)
MRLGSTILFVLLAALSASAQAIDTTRIENALPAFEAYVEQARQDWEVPRVAVAVVHDDRILWWKGFGEAPPDLDTVFAIGSTTKAFTAAMLALMVDGGGPGWEDRVVDHLPGFAMFDPWVTREMRVRDLLAQHTGLAPQALSALGGMGYSADQISSALRWVEPITSFRSSFAYVNSPHLVAGDLVARWARADSWHQVLDERILTPLGMTTTTWTAAGLDGNPNSAVGHARVDGEIKPISTGPFPYVFGPAGALNSNLQDMARWVRLQLGDGVFEGQRLIRAENLRLTRTPQTIISEKAFYGLGWLLLYLDDQPVIWHNGGTPGHTTFVGLQPEEDLGLIVLSNLGGTQMPDAVGLKFFELVHGIDGPDYSARFLAKRQEAEIKPMIDAAPIAGLSGHYQHPALGTVSVDDDLGIRFAEPGLSGVLEPIGPNLFRIRIAGGWLEEIGWGRLGEALFSPAGLSEPSRLTVYLGDEGEGSRFALERQADVQADGESEP